MKFRFTEKQIKQILRENIDSNDNTNSSFKLAQQLINNPNNEVLWRCFASQYEDSIFEHGYTSEYHGVGEGDEYGKGVYAFFRPYGCEKRVDTGGVGDKIMKCVLIGGFKDFIILKKSLAVKYYGTPDLKVQLKYFFGEENVDMIYQECERVARLKGCEIISDGWTGPVGRFVFGTKKGKFKDLVLASKAKGIVYNGGNDPNACLVFDPRSVIPLAVTTEKELPSRNAPDFKNWTYRLSTNLLEKIDKFKDFHSVGEHLIKTGLIKDYLRQPPKYNLLRVELNNGNTSFYNIETKQLISKVGFEDVSYPQEISGVIAIPFTLTNEKGIAKMLYVVVDGNNYYVCDLRGCRFNGIITIQKYDAMMANKMSNKVLNESYNFDSESNRENERKFREITGLTCKLESVYHRTSDIDSCKGIGKYGFSPQYSSTEYFGHGVYTALSVEACNKCLGGFGRYMIHGYLKDGYKNFLIFDERIAKQYYGADYKVSDQFKLLIRKQHYKYMLDKYGNMITNPPSTILKFIYDDIGRTNIRGVVVPYHSSGIYIPVICDWKAVIPYSYSEDDGRTWTQLLNAESYEHISNFKDALYAIQKLIVDGVVVDNYKKNGRYDWKSLESHPQFINGYLRVELTNGNVSFYSSKDEKLISYRGFDPQYTGSWSIKNGRPYLDCVVDENGRKAIFRVYRASDKGGYALCVRNNETGKYQVFTSLDLYDYFGLEPIIKKEKDYEQQSN